MTDKNLPIYSQNDVIETLKRFSDKNFNMENILFFASELMGISVDAILEKL